MHRTLWGAEMSLGNDNVIECLINCQIAILRALQIHLVHPKRQPHFDSGVTSGRLGICSGRSAAHDKAICEGNGSLKDIELSKR